MLDQIAQGRLILGLGRGFSEDLFDVFEVDPRQKRALFKQSLTRMLSIWAGDPIHQKDDRALYLSPRPHQSPYPRLWIAAFGPLALKQAAAFGCPYLASPMETFAELSQNLAQYRAALKAADQVQPEVVPVMRTIFITEDAALAAAVSEKLGQEGRRGSSQDHPDQPAFIVGSAKYVQDTLARYSEDLGVNYLIARGRIQGISEAQQIASHSTLITLFR
jgi:alkanesulfonate monooxygenase SsuD/methylene tetrahydromethanopterin reductase-like flavin-dependent oxidoreductase (luciferase family)